MNTLTLILSDHLVVLLLAFPLSLLLAAFLPLGQIERLCSALLRRIERKLNRTERGPVTLRMRGLFVTSALGLGSIILVAIVKAMVLLLLDGVWFDIALAALVIPFFPVLDELLKLQRLLRDNERQEAADLLAPLASHDPDTRDIHQLCRTAIEQSAIGLGTRILSPMFWYLLMGMPGMLLARVATLLEHRLTGPGRSHFGWVPERLAAILHFFPARLAVALMIIASAFTPSGHMLGALKITMRDGHRLLPPNDGWPVSCVAGILNIALGGPRKINGIPVGGIWANETMRAMATPQDVLRAFILLITSILLLWLLIASGAWALYLR